MRLILRRNIVRVSFVVATVVLSTSNVTTATGVRPIECTHPRWFDRWNTGNIKPGVAWDMGSPSPALIKALKEDKVPKGRALVPGCGRGYDVMALASPQRKVIGIDIVPKAVNEANIFLKENGVNSNEGEVKIMDFFELSESLEDKFDFIYDYTFLCALDPSVRQLWGQKVAALTKPGGVLFCLIFPINENKKDGPPFRVSLDIVKELLEKDFEVKQLEILPKELCHLERDGSNPLLGASGIGLFVRK